MDSILLLYVIPAVVGIVVSTIFMVLGSDDLEFSREMNTARNLSFLPVINFLIIIVLVGIVIRLIIDFIKAKIK
jgi:hypothetical protein